MQYHMFMLCKHIIIILNNIKIRENVFVAAGDKHRPRDFINIT